MPTYRLVPHPDHPCRADLRIEVEAERSRGDLLLIYWMIGDDGEELLTADPGDGERTDDLWKHTCFEAFVRVNDQAGYAELNFGPWGEWAAYAFDGYRTGMRNLPGPDGRYAFYGYKGPRDADDAYGWSCPVDGLFASEADWRLGLSAVIELKDGSKSFWALAHAPGPPDFHNPACFTARLPAPEHP